MKIRVERLNPMRAATIRCCIPSPQKKMTSPYDQHDYERVGEGPTHRKGHPGVRASSEMRNASLSLTPLRVKSVKVTAKWIRGSIVDVVYASQFRAV